MVVACDGKSRSVRFWRLQRQHLRVVNAAAHASQRPAALPRGRSLLHERQQSGRGRCERSTRMCGDCCSHAGNLNVWLVSHAFSSFDIKAAGGAAPPAAADRTGSSGASRNAVFAAVISLVYCRKTWENQSCSVGVHRCETILRFMESRAARLKREKLERLCASEGNPKRQRVVTVLPPPSYKYERQVPDGDRGLWLSEEVYPQVVDGLPGAHLSCGHDYARNAQITYDPERDKVAGLVRHAWMARDKSVLAVVELDESPYGEACWSYLTSVDARERNKLRDVSLGTDLNTRTNEVEVIELSLCERGMRKGTHVHP